MDQTLEKVTAFITRPGPRGVELLLFRHPNAGIQLPAGTVEEDEPHLDAALREAREETGLQQLSVVALIGHQDTLLPDDRCVVLHRTPVYARPDRASIDWAVFRRGLPCQIHRQADGFTQITYTEWDRFPDPQYVTYEITGWVPTETLCRRLRRYFYHLIATGESAAEWTVQNDNHLFRLSGRRSTTCRRSSSRRMSGCGLCGRSWGIGWIITDRDNSSSSSWKGDAVWNG